MSHSVECVGVYTADSLELSSLFIFVSLYEHYRVEKEVEVAVSSFSGSTSANAHSMQMT